MTLSTAEIESVRFHLGYGNIGVDGSPYTQDGFWHTFNQIVSPYLSTATETAATTAITAGAITVVTPDVMTDIVANSELVIDTGDDQEIVRVKVVTATTFTARFTKAHATTGYPIAVMCGKARLRLLLNDADKALVAVVDGDGVADAGLKSVGMGEVVWQSNSSPSFITKAKRAAYRQVQESISSLVRVPIAGSGGSSTSCELY